MKYFLDTEFLEGPQKKLFGHTKPTIDLISISIVSEYGREYYAVSKDFNLKEAWNRYQIKDNLPDSLAHGKTKEYWIRKNVLRPIFIHLIKLEINQEYDHKKEQLTIDDVFSYAYFKKLLKKYGKSNEQIAEEVQDFCGRKVRNLPMTTDYENKVEFYAYYADYDWVAFCWLFGRMIDLPKGFPKYCKDLKQILDEKAERKNLKLAVNDSIPLEGLEQLKQHPGYPKQTIGHNALYDALWDLKLYKFLENL